MKDLLDCRAVFRDVVLVAWESPGFAGRPSPFDIRRSAAFGVPARATAAPLGCLSNPDYGGRTRAAMALVAARRQLRELADALAFSRGQAMNIGLTLYPFQHRPSCQECPGLTALRAPCGDLRPGGMNRC